MLRLAASAATVAPTRPEPVKLTARTASDPTSAGPRAAPSPSNTLKTPPGNPAASAHSASTTAHRDEDSAGFNTTVFPNASAGAVFQSGIASGKFHGVMSATTPRGWCTEYCRPPAT